MELSRPYRPLSALAAVLCVTFGFAGAAYQPSAVLTQPVGTERTTSSMNSLAPFRYTWLDSVSGPPETTWTDTALVLTGTAMLHVSQDAESVMVVIQGWSPDAHWVQVRYYSLHTGESVAVDWSHKYKADSAYHVVRESIVDSMPGMPQQDSFINWQFWIMHNPHGDVKEGGRQPAIGEKAKPSVLRHIPAGAVAFDAMGRRALNPKPGVYFLRGAPAALPRKVLLIE
jgi:hypothetical protein